MTDQKADVDTCPLVSVCIPTYNRCEQLKTAVESVLKGSYDHVAIIISDNASSDGTQEWCESVCAADNRVSYFRHEVNQGPTRNFEFARSKANGKYFMWLADDDYLDPNYIYSCVDALEADLSLVIVAGLGMYYGNEGWFAYHGNIIQATSSLPLMRAMKYLWFVWDNSIFYGIYRLDMVRTCRFPDFLAGDWAWVATVLLKGKAAIIPDVHIHREFENSAASSIGSMVSVLGDPDWHAKYPWIAISMCMASHVAKSAVSQCTIKKSCIYIAVFIVTFFRPGNLRLMIAGIPHFRKVYRYIVPKRGYGRNGQNG